MNRTYADFRQQQVLSFLTDDERAELDHPSTSPGRRQDLLDRANKAWAAWKDEPRTPDNDLRLYAGSVADEMRERASAESGTPAPGRPSASR